MSNKYFVALCAAFSVFSLPSTYGLNSDSSEKDVLTKMYDGQGDNETSSVDEYSPTEVVPSEDSDQSEEKKVEKKKKKSTNAKIRRKKKRKSKHKAG